MRVYQRHRCRSINPLDAVSPCVAAGDSLSNRYILRGVVATLVGNMSGQFIDRSVRRGDFRYPFRPDQVSVVHDGTETSAYESGVGGTCGQITAIGDLSVAVSAKIVDTADLAVPHRFIDLHAHSEMSFLLDLTTQSKASQGVNPEFAGYAEVQKSYSSIDRILTCFYTVSRR